MDGMLPVRRREKNTVEVAGVPPTDPETLWREADGMLFGGIESIRA